MFGGVYDLNIDEKNRLAIPAKFRDILREHFTPKLICTLKSRTHILLFPEANWRKIEAELLDINTGGDPMVDKLVTVVLGNATPVEVDNAGRILIPQHLRKLVNFDRETTLVGRADRMQLWGREAWQAENASVLDVDPFEMAQRVAAQGTKIRI